MSGAILLYEDLHKYTDICDMTKTVNSKQSDCET